MAQAKRCSGVLLPQQQSFKNFRSAPLLVDVQQWCGVFGISRTVFSLVVDYSFLPPGHKRLTQNFFVRDAGATRDRPKRQTKTQAKKNPTRYTKPAG